MNKYVDFQYYLTNGNKCFTQESVNCVEKFCNFGLDS